jgi:hypothetical protein
MRAMDDPIMLLFYLYPFVIASAAAIIFDSVKRLPRENTGKKWADVRFDADLD